MVRGTMAPRTMTRATARGTARGNGHKRSISHHVLQKMKRMRSSTYARSVSRVFHIQPTSERKEINSTGSLGHLIWC